MPGILLSKGVQIKIRRVGKVYLENFPYCAQADSNLNLEDGNVGRPGGEQSWGLCLQQGDEMLPSDRTIPTAYRTALLLSK